MARTIQLADCLERRGYEVFIEEQNWFDTIRSSGSVLTGKPDAVAVIADDSVTVHYVKAGKPKPSDEIQARLDVFLLPLPGHSRWRGARLDGFPAGLGALGYCDLVEPKMRVVGAMGKIDRQLAGTRMRRGRWEYARATQEV